MDAYQSELSHAGRLYASYLALRECFVAREQPAAALTDVLVKGEGERARYLSNPSSASCVLQSRFALTARAVAPSPS